MAKMVKIERYDFTLHTLYGELKVGETRELLGAPDSTIGVVPTVYTNVRKPGIVIIESLKIGNYYALYKGKSHKLITPIDAWELSVNNKEKKTEYDPLPTINANILVNVKITRKAVDEEDKAPYFGITFHSQTKVVSD